MLSPLVAKSITFEPLATPKAPVAPSIENMSHVPGAPAIKESSKWTMVPAEIADGAVKRTTPSESPDRQKGTPSEPSQPLSVK
jgi:hypothetical protein